MQHNPSVKLAVYQLFKSFTMLVELECTISCSFVPSSSQIIPADDLQFRLIKIIFNIIPPSASGPSKWLLSSKFPHQKTLRFLYLLPHACHNPVHLTSFDLTIPIIFDKECKPYSSPKCNFLQSTVTHSHLRTNVHCRTLFLTNISLCSSPNMNRHSKNFLSYFFCAIFITQCRFQFFDIYYDFKRLIPSLGMGFMSCILLSRLKRRKQLVFSSFTSRETQFAANTSLLYFS